MYRLCGQSAVEDEFHVLCCCDRYLDLRSNIYVKANQVYHEFNTLPELDKFVFLIDNLQRDIITFLVKSLTRRRSYMFV